MSKDDNKPEGGVHFGEFPHPPKNISITIYGLEQWKNGIVSGDEVRVDILQKGKCVHSEVFSGKASAPFTRTVSISASLDDLVVVHNRPDLPTLKVSAEFADTVLVEHGQVFIKQAFLKDGIGNVFGPMNIGIADAESELSEKMRKLIDDAVSEGIRNSLRPGGLLHGR
ncbi:hypothetical protein [Erwinia rhapontici]|uniref:hypothetical protein n=1 Tax=Erwinia rhapontici TaxID=55212 RepID=UPI001331BFE4|nr:hypothetical protein [Erwinia rhapontici]MBP2157139.1 hypothetical protein [Erwinia rhapontici]